MGKPSPLDTPGKFLDIMKNAVVILDGSKVFELIATLALILIAIIIDTTTCYRTSVSGNPISGNIPTISSVVKPFAVGNNTADLFVNVLGNLFGNSS